MHFEIVGTVDHVESIAVGGRIHDIMRLREHHGDGRWRKMKGVAAVRLLNGDVRQAEIHWYEAHGVGRFSYKIKKLL